MANGKTRPKVIWTLICDDVRQELGGKFSLMGLFESIYSAKFPALHFRFAIVTELSGGKGDFAMKVRLLAPDRATVISESDASISLFNENQRHRDVSVRFNTTFNVPGTYWIEILIDGERAGMTPLTLQQVSDQNVH